MRSIPYELFSNVQFPPEVQRRRVRMVIEHELTETQRRAIVGHYFEGKSVREIASTLQISKSKVGRIVQSVATAQTAGGGCTGNNASTLVKDELF